MATIMAFIIGASCWRARGLDCIPNWFGRFGIWGVAVGGLVLGYTHNPYYALASVILAGVGASFGYFGGEIALSNPVNRNPHNYILLTLSGMVRMFPLAAASVFVGLQLNTFISVLSGVSFVPCYLLGLRLNKNHFTAIGESLFGGCLMLALAVGLGL